MRTGFALLGVYLVFSAWCVWEAMTCTGYLCGLILYLPVLIPWLPIVEVLDFGEYIDVAVMILLFLVNCYILFWIGKIAAKLVIRMRSD